MKMVKTFEDRLVIVRWLENNMKESGTHKFDELMKVVEADTGFRIRETTFRSIMKTVPNFKLKKHDRVKNLRRKGSQYEKVRCIAKMLLEIGKQLGHTFSEEEALKAIVSAKSFAPYVENKDEK